MNRHPYLRAYMAGCLGPTWFLLVILLISAAAHAFHELPPAIERAIVFPMAAVPNLWGLWNVMYFAAGIKGRLSLGLFGALLPFLLVPAGLALARFFDLPWVSPSRAAAGFPAALLVYYLVWKHVVSFFNRVVGLM